MHIITALCAVWGSCPGQHLLIPMDLTQTDHLKAYGVAYRVLEEGQKIQWLLNYRGGSFLLPYHEDVVRECRLRNVASEPVDGAVYAAVVQTISENNMESIILEKAPAIAVYVHPTAQPWDDAVTLALSYAEIPYETIWDEAVLSGALERFDWLHLHHEDFTGQYGKFYQTYRNAAWYTAQKTRCEQEARRLGYAKVSHLKLAVVNAIYDYMTRGGFLFAMCSATDTYDIALAAAGTDICHQVFDGDPVAPDWASKLDFSRCLAFTDFTCITDPAVYEFSDIDTTPLRGTTAPSGASDYFTLFEFSAKYDPVPAMLTQNHVSIIHNFMGQTTGFHEHVIKPAIVILARNEGSDEIKYIHGNCGRGTFTFLGGHDPEDYQHFVGDPPTDLQFHRNSPGYRLILNNILFPAAKKQKQKT
ncbi:asparagine synthetase B [bacterium]|nr:asparagine synthetase B [bacterium]